MVRKGEVGEVDISLGLSRFHLWFFFFLFSFFSYLTANFLRFYNTCSRDSTPRLAQKPQLGAVQTGGLSTQTVPERGLLLLSGQDSVFHPQWRTRVNFSLVSTDARRSVSIFALTADDEDNAWIITAAA